MAYNLICSRQPIIVTQTSDRVMRQLNQTWLNQSKSFYPFRQVTSLYRILPLVVNSTMIGEEGNIMDRNRRVP